MTDRFKVSEIPEAAKEARERITDKSERKLVDKALAAGWQIVQGGGRVSAILFEILTTATSMVRARAMVAIYYATYPHNVETTRGAYFAMANNLKRFNGGAKLWAISPEGVSEGETWEDGPGWKALQKALVGVGTVGGLLTAYAAPKPEPTTSDTAEGAEPRQTNSAPESDDTEAPLEGLPEQYIGFREGLVQYVAGGLDMCGKVACSAAVSDALRHLDNGAILVAERAARKAEKVA